MLQLVKYFTLLNLLYIPSLLSTEEKAIMTFSSASSESEDEPAERPLLARMEGES